MKESDLHRQICQLLDKLGVVYIHSRTDRKTTNAAGTPDFIFAILVIDDPSYDIPIAWEVKLEKGKLSPEQEIMKTKMENPPNGWRYEVIRSLDDAINELKEIGLIQ